MRHTSSIAALPLTLAAALLPFAAGAHAGRLAADDKATAPIHKVEKLADGAYAIIGRGGNIGLFVGQTSAVLVDDQFQDIAPGLLAAIRSVTDKPLRYVINTHYHGDHTGANATLEKQVYAIVAHANVRKRLELEQAKLEPAKRGGLPSITFGEEDPNAKARMNFHLDGLEIHLVHYGPAHTDGDVLVGVPATLVLHMGDVFFNGRTPYIDVAAGGSLEGMIANVEKVLSWLPDGAKIIPGHGPVGTKQDMARFGQFLRAVEAHVKANPGKSGAELDKSFDHKAFADFTDLPPFLPWPAFFELAAGRVPEKK